MIDPKALTEWRALAEAMHFGNEREINASDAILALLDALAEETERAEWAINKGINWRDRAEKAEAEHRYYAQDIENAREAGTVFKIRAETTNEALRMANERAERWKTRTFNARRELEALRDRITALADERDALPPGPERVITPQELRALVTEDGAQ